MILLFNKKLSYLLLIGLLLTILSVNIPFSARAFSTSSAGVSGESGTIDQWPTFHHDPAHSGFSTSTAPKTNQTAWICYMGGLGRPFAVADGLVYAPTYGVNLYAIDANTGAIRWSYTGDGGYGPLPTVANGYVYFGTELGRVYALNAQTSALKWSFQAGGRLDEVCPTVVNEVVYIGSHSGKLYAIDALSGYQLWSYQTGDDIRTSAAVVDGKVYVGSDDGKMYAFNAASGTVEWTFSTGAYITSSPTVVEGKLYFGSENNNIYALNASTGGLIWKYLTNSKIVYCSPAVAYNTVYIGSYYGTMFYALNAFTGNLIWKFNTGAVSSAPAIADGVVYLGSTNRNVYAFDAYTGGILWKYEVKDIITSSPAIAYGKMYIGSHDGNVYAFGTAQAIANLTVLDSLGGRLYPHPGMYLSSDTGDSTWLIAHPDIDYSFSHFLIDGKVTSAQYLEEDGDYTYYLNMDTNHTVQAVFTIGSPVFPTLTVLDSLGGQIYPQPGSYIASHLGGEAPWIIAHPNPGYSFNYFLIDGKITSNQYFEEDGDYTHYLKMDTSHTVQAIFTPS